MSSEEMEVHCVERCLCVLLCVVFGEREEVRCGRVSSDIGKLLFVVGLAG